MYEAVANSAEVIAGVLGIAVTAVAIIVELAATRYNHRITGLFVREPLNLVALSFFVATTLMCVWVMALSTSDGSPVLHQITMGMITTSLLLLLPYFVYVLSFISPDNVIKRVSRRTYREIVRCSRHYSPDQRMAVAVGVEEIQDVLRSAVERGDRDIAIECVNAMVGLLERYHETAPALSDEWYLVDAEMQQDPDFATLESSALARIERDRTWLEHKVCSLLLKTMRLCSSRLNDVANHIYIRTRQLALAQPRESKQLELTLNTFNSYLRANITMRDVRTAYFGYNQYRKIAEVMIARGWSAEVAAISRHLQEYGLLAFEFRLPFLLEVCAHELLGLLKGSLEFLDDVVDDLLESLLTLDQDLEAELNRATLLGVRRAQLRAAVALLCVGEQARADRVIADLAAERHVDLDELINKLEKEQREDFWELTPVGINFSYLEPDERAELDAVRQKLAVQRAEATHQ